MHVLWCCRMKDLEFRSRVRRNMSAEDQEYEFRKKAIFDSMSKRGQERILRIGYENWDPFQEPKDPRERIFSSASLRASALIKAFLEEERLGEESVGMQKELFELCKGVLQGEARATVLYKLCLWLARKRAEGMPV